MISHGEKRKNEMCASHQLRKRTNFHDNQVVHQKIYRIKFIHLLSRHGNLLPVSNPTKKSIQWKNSK